MKWADVDLQWRKLTLADKVDATRVIPLTPYVAQQLVTLPCTNEFVFASTCNHPQRARHRRDALTVVHQAHRILIEFERVTRPRRFRYFRFPCLN